MAPLIANFQVLVSHWTIDFEIFSGIISMKPNISAFQNGMTLDFMATIEEVMPKDARKCVFSIFLKKLLGPILGTPNLVLMISKA